MKIIMNEKEIDIVYNNDYFKLNKKLQLYAGLWPYQSNFKKRIRRTVLYTVLLLFMIPVCNGTRIWCGVNMDLCGENITGIIYTVTILSKYWVTIFSENKLRNIYQQVAINWLRITDPKEHAILQEYARQGRIKTIGYVVYMTVGGICFCQLPMLPIILDILMPLNESRPTVLFIKGEFIMDPYKNFYKLYVYFMLFTFYSVLAVLSIDTTYTIVVHQILGIFSIIKYRLHLATVTFDPTEDVSYKIIIKAIKLHKEALQFIDLIETSYSLFFFTLLGLTLLFISTSVAILLTQTIDEILDTIRFAMIVFGVVLHLLYLSWPGQKIIDHSYELLSSTYDNEWYNLSEKSKNLLKIVMLKCLKPCVFTAGGLYVMNMENFGSIMKTGMSYVAVVSSFR